eukprot:11170042-Lingulodinium_polyedra.AAC.1
MYITPRAVALFYRTVVACFKARTAGHGASEGGSDDAAYFNYPYLVGRNPARGHYALYDLCFLASRSAAKDEFPEALRSLRG